MGFPTEFAAPRDCDHNWEAVSMAFETQLLDEHGRVQVRQPDLNEGRVYFICRGCASHTYMTTQWIGCRMYGSEDALAEAPAYAGVNRDSWRLNPDA